MSIATIATIDDVRELIGSLRDLDPDPEPYALIELQTRRRFRRRHHRDLYADVPSVEWEPWDLPVTECAPSLETMLCALLDGRAAEVGTHMELSGPGRHASPETAVEPLPAVIDWDGGLAAITGTSVAAAFTASRWAEAHAEVPNPVSELTPRQSELLMTHVYSARWRCTESAIDIAVQELADRLAPEPWEAIGRDQAAIEHNAHWPAAGDGATRPATANEIGSPVEAGWIAPENRELAAAMPLMVCDERAGVPEPRRPADDTVAYVPDVEARRWEQHETGEMPALTVGDPNEVWERYETASQRLIIPASRPAAGWRARVGLAAGWLRDRLSRPARDEPIGSA